MIQSKKLRFPLHILFALYLTALLLYSLGIIGSYKGLTFPLIYPEWSHIEAFSNFIPFKTMLEMLQKLSLNQINADIVSGFFIGNLISFAPLTLFMRLLYNTRLVRILLTTAAISIPLEMLQLFTMTGSLDVDAIILRCAGVTAAYALISGAVYIVNRYKSTRKSRKSAAVN